MRRKVWILLFVAALVVILPQFVIPFALPAGMVHTPVPASFGEPTTWPYAFGALVCHQRPDRSFSLAGNQLPVCERCLAIELGMAAAFALAVLVAPRGGFVASLSAFLPERLRSTAGVLAVGLLLMLPMVLDGGLQLVTTYVSATPQRVLTGFLYGIGQAGIVIGTAAWLVACGSESLMPSRRR
jgi:uncharacterized membrane protein